MTVISASSAGVKDMADGSLRITFEFEPRHAADAFALFGPRGRSVAIAALADGHARASDTSPEPVAETPKQEHKGGEWAKLAGMWCNDADFWAFANATTHGGVLWHIDSAQSAKEFMCEMSEIDSRVQLDNDPAALKRFNEWIRFPFMKYMQARGIRK